ncbi:MAG: methionyl-tRNA formyltransferase [Actinomycetota bacterium]|nr:methionyl-tRNA formyltransferase [Actinomycetota bacterium]
MRIVVNGQQAFGAEVFNALLKRGEDVVAVYCAPDKPGAGPDPLRQAAEAAGVPVRQPASFKTPEAVEEMQSLSPDLMVMAFVTLFVPEPVLNAPTRGSIQYHPSLLPRHRGPSAINWAIIGGEDITGVTVFWPDDGLDTGPVLLQREITIDEDDTLGSLYFDKLFPVGVEAMMDAVDLVRDSDDPPKLMQDETQATYESWCRKDDVEVDWGKPVTEVYNLIRGCDPRPGAWTMIGDERVSLFGARQVEGDESAQPGKLLDVSDEGLLIAASGGAIRIERVGIEAGKLDACQWAQDTGVQPGAVLGAERPAVS